MTGTTKKSIFILLIVIVLGAIGYFVYRAKFKSDGNVINIKSSPSSSPIDELSEIIAKIGQFYELPTGDTPTLATVSDPEKLKGQAFFERAKKGDKVLLYAKAKKAILYDPVANKIIEIAPLNIGEGSTTPAP